MTTWSRRVGISRPSAHSEESWPTAPLPLANFCAHQRTQPNGGRDVSRHTLGRSFHGTRIAARSGLHVDGARTGTRPYGRHRCVDSECSVRGTEPCRSQPDHRRGQGRRMDGRASRPCAAGSRGLHVQCANPLWRLRQRLLGPSGDRRSLRGIRPPAHLQSDVFSAV